MDNRHKALIVFVNAACVTQCLSRVANDEIFEKMLGERVGPIYRRGS